MKLVGGHNFRIAGRPSGIVHSVPLPPVLRVPLERCGVLYNPAATEGAEVGTGDPLAHADLDGHAAVLPAPAPGRIAAVNAGECIVLETRNEAELRAGYKAFQPQRIDASRARTALLERGIWPFIWSSATGETPSPAGEQPRAVIVNCVLTEPFRARGKVILRRSWDHIMHGIKFLPRLLRDYGTLEIVLTNREDPVSRMMYTELAGHAWVRFHTVPLLYPAEHPRVLSEALRRYDSSISRNDVIWAMDIQGIEALGATLGSGLPLRERVVALGGPGCHEPKHLAATIGTPLKHMIGQELDRSVVLRGGLLTGEPVDTGSYSLGYDDDALFLLPKSAEREFLSFLRAGFTRTSAFPAFASALTGACDSQVSTALRGEKRPCIACGQCEDVCPAGLLPQVLHRYLYRQALDEAEALGLARCMDCGLCTYVCPSKISLAEEFKEAEEELRKEREEAQAAERSESDT